MNKSYLFILAAICLSSLACSSTDSASEKKPNIVLIMVDDMGFSDIGCYGGEIPTPNIDKLAGEGVRFSQFYNTSRCCPTRASLLTGLYQHQAGMGMMTGDYKDGQEPKAPGYLGYLNQQCITIAEALKPQGYNSYMTGKWHVGKAKKEWWPLQRGFDKFYGLLGGSSNFFKPAPKNGYTYNNQSVEIPTDSNYYTTNAFTDTAIQFLSSHDKNNPFFLYVAYTAPHWPLHALPEDISLFEGKYDQGWDSLRYQRWKKQLELGVVKEEWGLSPRCDEVPAWINLSEEEQSELSLRMAIYAAMIYRVDANIGKLMNSIEKMGEKENTIVFFLSDNGACPEPWNDKTPNGIAHLGKGSLKHAYNRNKVGQITYGQAWANASNTPFRRYKTQSHEGGISTPMVVNWPKGIKNHGNIIDAHGHIIDIMPTLMELSGAQYPDSRNNTKLHKLEGLSLVPLLTENKPLNREALYWEHRLEGAVRKGEYKALYRQNTEKWYLYNIEKDRNELNDLSGENPEMLENLKNDWYDWANTHLVLPKN